jgi:hypothetical protein
VALYTNLIVVAGINTATNTPVVMTSPDAVTWTPVSSWPGGIANRVSVTGDTYFVETAAANTANNYAWSNDGATWTLGTMTPAAACIEWAGTYYVDLASNVSYRSTTPGGSWTGPTTTGNGSGQVGRRLINRNGLLVGAFQTGTQPPIVYSTDEGATWSTVSGRPAYDMDYGAGRYVIGTSPTNSSSTDWIRTSTDGTSWSYVTTGVGAGHYVASLRYGNGLFVGIGANAAGPPGVRTFTSTDGLSWSVHTPTGLPSTGFYSTSKMAFWNGRFIWIIGGGAVTPGDEAKIYSSTDGVTWTSTSFTNRDWRGVAAGQARPRGGTRVDGAVHF